jgi:hypothetical protein
MLKRIFLISILVVATNSYAIIPVTIPPTVAQTQRKVNCILTIIKAIEQSESEAEKFCKSLESNNNAYKQCFDNKYSELYKLKITALKQDSTFDQCQS